MTIPHWRVPDLTPDPYIGNDYRPGWAPRDLNVRRLYQREDLVWLDRQWQLTEREPVDPTRLGAWWTRVKAGDSVIWPIGEVILAFVVLFGLLIAFAGR